MIPCQNLINGTGKGDDPGTAKADLNAMSEVRLENMSEKINSHF